ncbi:MAG: carboxypeptidase-like regulatory domain-containing protein [candidate division KSB1 bacterium]|nr:carboxypeptidase-like regulatory domain-containing protein [candidate division KSB1 bacterium]
MCCWLLSCTTPAEHSNPLDPESPAYQEKGTITGRVTSFYQPYSPLPGAEVRLLPGGESRRTSTFGEFTFSGLSPGRYMLLVTAEGFADDSAGVEVAARQTREVAFHLDAVPQVTGAKVTAAHVKTRASLSDTDFVFLTVTAEVSDGDGPNDLQRVQVEIPAAAFDDSLRRSSTPARWERTFSPEELRESGGRAINPYNLVGESFHISARDAPGAQARSAPFQLVRVIAEEPLPQQPANGQVLTSHSPQLQWFMPPLSFEHTFTIQVFKLIGGFPTLLLTISELPAGTMALPYPGRLTSGSYFWTVAVVDRFGNSSRSKEATFVVQ